MIETWGPFLHFAAQNSQASSSLSRCTVTLYVNVCVCVHTTLVCAEHFEQMTDIWQFEHAQWWAHRDSRGSICWVCSPNQPSWGMLPVVITNMASSCLCNICSTLLISLACFHRKWLTKWLNPWPTQPQLSPTTLSYCLMCCVCLETHVLSIHTSFFSLCSYQSSSRNDLHHLVLLAAQRTDAFQIVPRNHEQGHGHVGGWQCLSLPFQSLFFFKVMNHQNEMKAVI